MTAHPSQTRRRATARQKRSSTSILLSTVLVTGCGQSLYFGGYTRVGIDASVDSVGIGVRQAAVTISPPKRDGTAHNVVAKTDMDLSLADVVISEQVAVGDAAIALTETATESDFPPRADTPSSLFFGAFTSWSLIEIGTPNSASPGFLFGFKRATAVRMPVIEDKVGSAYADFEINTTQGSLNGVTPSALPGGVHNSYVFATGQPAVNMARRSGAGLSRFDRATVEPDAFSGSVSRSLP